MSKWAIGCTHLVQIFTKPVFKVKICAQTVIFIYFLNQPSVGQKTQLFSKVIVFIFEETGL